jgi:hypothetical protein
MEVQAPLVFLRSFSQMADPSRHNVRHRFSGILAIAICYCNETTCGVLSVRVPALSVLARTASCNRSL